MKDNRKRLAIDVTGAYRADADTMGYIRSAVAALTSAGAGLETCVYADRKTAAKLGQTCVRQTKRCLEDAYLGLGGGLPPASMTGKTIAVVYSLDFVSAMDGYSWLRRHLLNLKYRRLCRRADWLISPAAGTAADLTKYYYVPKSRIAVVEDPGSMPSVIRKMLSATR